MDISRLLSERVGTLTPSATLQINALAKEYKRAGKPVLSFATGEPDFPTPAGIIKAAEEALEQGKTKYTATAGIPELREAISRRYQERYGLRYKPENTVVTAGGKQALYNLFQTILDPGDEVIIFNPYWVSYPEMIKLAGGLPVEIPTEISQEFVPDPERVKRAISARTKAILINSPNNPTGSVYPREVLAELGQLAVEHDLLLISDEIYEDLVYEGDQISLPTLGPEVKGRTIVISGVSKSYSMTGWRLGWAVGPETLIQGISGLQSHSTSNASSISQYGALAALTTDIPELTEMIKAFRKRREIMYGELKGIPGLTVSLPKGAFYLFIDIKGIAQSLGSREFCHRLLTETYVAAVPGEAFGAPGHIRLSYAAAEQDILEGCRRMAQFVKGMTA